MLIVTRFLLAATVAYAVSAYGADELRRTVKPPSERSHGIQLTEDKPAWEWSTEERLAVRFDPSRIAERELEYQASSSSSGVKPDSATGDTAAPAEGGTVVIIDGRRHPELFLPHELFDALMTGLIPDVGRERQRKYYRAGILSFGFDESLFWSQLSSVANEYVDYKYRTLTSRSESNDKCRAAFTALAAARLLFGRDRFDQFLYQVVAPGTWFSSATNATDPSAEVRRVEEGCH